MSLPDLPLWFRQRDLIGGCLPLAGSDSTEGRPLPEEPTSYKPDTAREEEGNVDTIPVVMGCDPHLDTLVIAVVDTTGMRVIDQTAVANTASGYDEVIEVCRTLGVCRVGIEGASGPYGYALAGVLDTAGIEVFEVPTQVTATERRGEGRSKSDPADARAIARAVATGRARRWCNDTDLEAIRRLVNRRETLVRQQTQSINALRAILAETDPGFAANLPRLRSQRGFAALTDVSYPDSEITWLIQDLTQECLARHLRIKDVTAMIKSRLGKAGEALMTIPGCGVVTAGWILAHIAGTDHFATEARFAMWAGAAPLDASSGRQQRHRLNRGGNRQLNRALHTIIAAQHKAGGEARHYIQRRLAEGKTTREAFRACKRHLARKVWKILHNNGLTPHPTTTS